MGIMLAALIMGLIVVYVTTSYPRTDDAEVFANFIGIAPQVDGPITNLAVQDNEFVKQGGLLFQIDPRPYEYTLQKARSDLNTLEGQIVDESRTIASQQSAVGAAQANTESTAASVDRAAAAVSEAKANVASAKAELDRAQAELLYTSNNFHRIEPLLAKQFVTVDQVDQARTAVTAREQAVAQSRSQLALAEAQVLSARAQYDQAKANVHQRPRATGAIAAQRPNLGAADGAARGKSLSDPYCGVQPEQQPRLRALRCASYQPDDLAGRLRAHRSASLYPDRHTHLVGGGEFPRDAASPRQAGNARGCTCCHVLQ